MSIIYVKTTCTWTIKNGHMKLFWSLEGFLSLNIIFLIFHTINFQSCLSHKCKIIPKVLMAFRTEYHLLWGIYSETFCFYNMLTFLITLVDNLWYLYFTSFYQGNIYVIHIYVCALEIFEGEFFQSSSNLMKEVVSSPSFGNLKNEVQGSSPRSPKLYGQVLNTESILLISECFRV